MRAVLLGAPGAGKGTLANLMKDKYKLNHISTGDILREEMKSGSSLGNEVKKFVEGGELVPDNIIIQIIEKKLSQNTDLEEGFILDGFPRTTSQAEELDKILEKIQKSIEIVFYIDVSLPVIIRRLTGRRICRECNAIYHTINMPPKVADICDSCGGALYQRPDDNEETIKTRMDVYKKSTTPIIEYYENLGKLTKLNGDQDAQDVLQHLITTWNEYKKSNQDKICR